MASMKDVARLAGVSTATVSRVLAHPEKVRARTRQAVLDAVRQLNYHPGRRTRDRNPLTGASGYIAIVLPDINNPFFAPIVRGAEDVARASHYDVLIYNTDNDIERERSYIHLFGTHPPIGVIFLTARVDNADVEQLASKIPLVLSCEYSGANVYQVCIDNRLAAYEATQHLIQLGHQRIAHISGPHGIVLSQDRYEGYSNALTAHGIPLRSEYVFEGTFFPDSGAAVMKSLLELPEPPTAAFCANDEMAMGVIAAARNMGYRVPTDFAVVGFDDIRFASLCVPALTTIHQPMYEIGTTAAGLLLEQIRGLPYKPRRVLLPHRFIVRESCGGNQARPHPMREAITSG